MSRPQIFALGWAVTSLLAGGINFASYLSGHNDPWKIAGGIVFSLLGVVAILRVVRETR